VTTKTNHHFDQEKNSMGKHWTEMKNSYDGWDKKDKKNWDQVEGLGNAIGTNGGMGSGEYRKRDYEGKHNQENSKEEEGNYSSGTGNTVVVGGSSSSTAEGAQIDDTLKTLEQSLDGKLLSQKTLISIGEKEYAEYNRLGAFLTQTQTNVPPEQNQNPPVKPQQPKVQPQPEPEKQNNKDIQNKKKHIEKKG